MINSHALVEPQSKKKKKKTAQTDVQMLPWQDSLMLMMPIELLDHKFVLFKLKSVKNIAWNVNSVSKHAQIWTFIHFFFLFQIEAFFTLYQECPNPDFVGWCPMGSAIEAPNLDKHTWSR